MAMHLFAAKLIGPSPARAISSHTYLGSLGRPIKPSSTIRCTTPAQAETPVRVMTFLYHCIPIPFSLMLLQETASTNLAPKAPCALPTAFPGPHPPPNLATLLTVSRGHRVHTTPEYNRCTPLGVGPLLSRGPVRFANGPNRINWNKPWKMR